MDRSIKKKVGLLFVAIILSAPVITFVLAAYQQSKEFPPFFGVLQEEQAIRSLLKTAHLSFWSALTATILGLGLNRLLSKLPQRCQNVYLLIYSFGFLLSPYVFVQGWIGWIGNNGILWRWLGGQWFTIYSEIGLVVMLVLIHFPLALLFIHFSEHSFPKKWLETADLYRFKGWRYFRMVWLPRSAPGMAMAFCIVFIFSFWSYDVPSMLRQNTYMIEIMAAFGAFYDYSKALALCAPLIVVTLVTMLILLRFFKPLWVNVRNAAAASSTASVVTCGVLLLPIVGWVVPFIGLFDSIGSWDVFLETFLWAKKDVWNTIWNGSVSTLISMAMACFIGMMLYKHKTLSIWIGSFLILMISLPAVLGGIGFIYLFNFPAFNFLSSVRLVFVEVWITFPFLLILLLFCFRRIPIQWNDTRLMFGVSFFRYFLKVILPHMKEILILGFMIGFLLAIRDVPASLLNYPPNGATLALTIDTMLHFEQPEKVASLCLIQAIMGGALFMIAIILVGNKKV